MKRYNGTQRCIAEERQQCVMIMMIIIVKLKSNGSEEGKKKAWEWNVNVLFFEVGIKSGSPSSSKSAVEVNGISIPGLPPFFESLRYNSSLPEPRRVEPNSRLYDFSISTLLMGCRILWMMNPISEMKPRSTADAAPMIMAIVVFSKSRTLAGKKGKRQK